MSRYDIILGKPEYSAIMRYSMRYSTIALKATEGCGAVIFKGMSFLIFVGIQFVNMAMDIVIPASVVYFQRCLQSKENTNIRRIIFELALKSHITVLYV